MNSIKKEQKQVEYFHLQIYKQTKISSQLSFYFIFKHHNFIIAWNF